MHSNGPIFYTCPHPVTQKHRAKFIVLSCRGEYIPKEVVAFKDDCGNWSRNRRSPATNSQDLAAESLSECESDTVNETQVAFSDACARLSSDRNCCSRRKQHNDEARCY